MWVKDTDGDQFRYQAIELVKAHMGLRREDRRDSCSAALSAI